MKKSQQHASLAAIIAGLALAGQAFAQTESWHIIYLVGDPTPVPLTYAFTMSNFAPVTGQIQLSLRIVDPSGGQTASGQALSSGWLSTSLSSPTVPSTLTISVNPVGVPVGTYSGNLPDQYSLTVDVDSSNQEGPIALQQFSVFLTVIGPTTPAILSVLNAASFVNALLAAALPQSSLQSSVSPGEIVSIFGSAFGPVAPVGLQVDSKGKVATELGGVQVLFDGYAAPLTYVSATQINCVVPYEVRPGQIPGGLVPLQVSYLGQTLLLLEPGQLTPIAQPASTIPGIFTATGTGTGQAAALNPDNTPNMTSNPAAAGSIISVYMTGEGQTAPAGVTGSVTCSSGCSTTSQIPKPVLPVLAFVGGQPATVAFYGEAPGLTSGVMQVNVTIPPNAPRGAASLVIRVGSSSSQTGVTVAVK
jgi:uncharacterized protein (TIGR03437 family)